MAILLFARKAYKKSQTLLKAKLPKPLKYFRGNILISIFLYLKTVSLLFVVSLKGTDTGKSPAGATTTLGPDFGNSSW